MESRPKFIWLDGDLIDSAEANVHVSTYALHYGIGFFEGIRAHATSRGPAIFRLGDHLRRLHRSLAVYGLRLPYSEEVLARACHEVVSANGLGNCYLRPLVFLGEGENPVVAPMRCAIIASQDGPFVGATDPGHAAKAQISSFQRYASNALPPAAKASGQYLNSYLGEVAALSSGFDEAIFLNENGLVADAWASNVFIVTDGEVVTPPNWTGGLPGITRDSILRLAAEDGLPVAERPLVRSDLYLADELFLTGTATGVKAVASVDGRPMAAGAPGPVTTRIAGLLAAAVTGQAQAHPDWVEYVNEYSGE
jgi:branched-chain amino acid aminotransferase